MKKSVVLICFFLFGIIHLEAQIGLNASYKNIETKSWDQLLDNDSKQTNVDFFLHGLSIGIDYWVRLKNYRIEFHPEANLLLSQNQKEVDHTIFQSSDAMNFGFELHTNFYIMDFYGDCECPTFTKDAEVFKKGFFLQLSPGYTYAQLKNTVLAVPGDPSSGTKINAATSTAFKISAGIGIDLGISKMITITPMIRYGRAFSMKWDNLASDLNAHTLTDLNETNWDEITAAIRLGLRFDGNKF